MKRVLVIAPADDLRAAPLPVTLLHGERDRTAPLHYVRDFSDELQRAGVPVELEVVAGDHHLAVRRPEAVGGSAGPAPWCSAHTA